MDAKVVENNRVKAILCALPLGTPYGGCELCGEKYHVNPVIMSKKNSVNRC
jgi:hypothetical protein